MFPKYIDVTKKLFPNLFFFSILDLKNLKYFLLHLY